jgi:hypothetical protein
MSPPSALVSAPLPSLDPFASLLVRVLWGSDHTPAADVRVLVMTWGAKNPFRDCSIAITGADGTFLLERLSPGTMTLYGDRGGGGSAELVASERSEVEFEIPPGITIDGRVVDGEGRAVGGATIWLSAYGNRGDGTEVAICAPDGRFRLRDVEEWHWVAARAAGHAPSGAHEIHGNPGETKELTLVLPARGGRLAGSVRSPDGAPVHAAQVLLLHGPFSQAEDIECLAPPPPTERVTLEDGTFEVDGLAAGRVTVRARAPGFAPTTSYAAIELGVTSRVELVLELPARVVGVVRDERGVAVSGASVVAGTYGDFDSGLAKSGSDGAFRLEDLRAGEISLHVSHREKGKAGTSLTLVAGEESTWDPRLESGQTLGGRVIDHHDQPLAGWLVVATVGESFHNWPTSDYTDDEGRFLLPQCPREDFIVQVREPETWASGPAVVVEDFVVGQDDLLIRVPYASRATASIRGRFVDSQGTPIGDARASAMDEELHFVVDGDVEVATGRFQLGPLRPGTYEVEVESESTGRKAFPPRSIAADESLDLGDLVLEPAGRVAVKIVTPGDASGELPTIYFALRTPAGAWAGGFQAQSGSGRSEPIAPGDYVLSMRSNEWWGEDLSLAIPPAETFEVSFAVEPATVRSARLCLPPEAATPGMVRFTVHDTTGRLVQEQRTDLLPAAWDADRCMTIWIGGLPIGDYALDIETDVGLGARGSIRIDVLEPESAPLEYVLK